jgi:hypothetical protein
MTEELGSKHEILQGEALSDIPEYIKLIYTYR